MLLTVTWPANRPPTSIANGSVTPARACLSSRRTSWRKRVGRASPPGGTVASHGTSQAALRCRARRQSSWSLAGQRPDDDVAVLTSRAGQRLTAH